MVTEVTATDYGGRMDPREVGQERAEGTVDLDTNGDGSVSVDLSGKLDDGTGLGLFGVASSGQGTASLSGLTADSVTLNVSGGTADATDVPWTLVVSEDGFAL